MGIFAWYCWWNIDPPTGYPFTSVQSWAALNEIDPPHVVPSNHAAHLWDTMLADATEYSMTVHFVSEEEIEAAWAAEGGEAD